MDIKEYSKISADVWQLFKHKHEGEFTWDQFWDGVHKLNNDYEGHPGYKFMQALLKVYFDQIKEVQHE